jgi:enoyl-CoA hydratase/carnithine racemase
MAIHYKIKEHIAEITIDRQEVRNALDIEAMKELSQILFNVRDNPEVWVAIITGAGDKAFSAGADLSKIPIQLAESGKNLIETASPFIFWDLEVYKPLIAAVNGLALGGGLELALACDIRICSDNATFGLVEPLRGIMPGGGGTQRLPRSIPLGLALEMLFTGRRITAQEAYRIGLVSKVASPQELMNSAYQLAEEICQCAPLAVQAIKQAAIIGLRLNLHDGLLLEQQLLQNLGLTEDATEGVTSFLQKKKPEWKAK